MCPMCGCTYVVLLGILGHTNHLRCRDCGWTFSDTDNTMFREQHDAPSWGERD